MQLSAYINSKPVVAVPKWPENVLLTYLFLQKQKSCQYTFRTFVKNCQRSDRGAAWTNFSDQLISSSQHRCYRCTRLFTSKDTHPL